MVIRAFRSEISSLFAFKRSYGCIFLEFWRYYKNTSNIVYPDFAWDWIPCLIWNADAIFGFHAGGELLFARPWSGVLMFTITNLKSINFIYSFVRIMVTLIIISILDLKTWNYEVSVSIIYLDILFCFLDFHHSTSCFLKHSCSPRFHFSLCLLNLTCNSIVVFRGIMFSFHAFLKHVHVLEVKCEVSENISSFSTR